MTITTSRGELIDLRSIDIALLNTPVVVRGFIDEAFAYCSVLEFLGVAKEFIDENNLEQNEDRVTLENLNSVIDVYVWDKSFRIPSCTMCGKHIA